MTVDMVKRFWRSRRCGFYLSVAREGTMAAGDPIRFTRLAADRPSIESMFTARSAPRS